MEDSLKKFIDKLAKTTTPKNSYNMWSFDHSANAVRRKNLELYLLQMAERKPEVMLVGEAPGYQGSRWTGVNFCSEFIVLSGIAEIGMFGKNRGYQKTDEWEKVWKEPSATIVWQSMRQVKHLPLIWASFPFHPHKPGNNLSNRAPSKEELALGRPFIANLKDIFKINKIIAVGNKAEETLNELGYDVAKIRHPANGGANLFRQGIKKHFG